MIIHTYIHTSCVKVGDADRHLNEVQNNVSTKINFISAELYSTVKDLNEAVISYVCMYVCMYVLLVYVCTYLCSVIFVCKVYVCIYVVLLLYVCISLLYYTNIQYMYIHAYMSEIYLIIYKLVYVCMYVCR